MNNILENKSNYLIVKENNLIKLFSYKSLVSVYNTETKTFEEVPYNYINDDGDPCSYSLTTKRHQNKFKKFIQTNF